MIDIRERKTDRINRARIKLELKRSVRPTIVVLACALLGLALVGYVVSQMSPALLSSTYTAKFELDDATGVAAGIHEVRFKGIPVGDIAELEIVDERPIVTVEIQERYGKLYRDLRAQLRPTTALQDMSLDIVDRGSPEAGEVDPEVPVSATRTETPVNISDVLNMLAPGERQRFRQMLDDLGNGMADRGASLRAILVEGVPFVKVAGDIARQLRQRQPVVARLVHNTAALTGELGTREEQLRRLVREGGGALSALQEGSGDLDATLAELPPTLTRLDSSLAAVRSVVDEVDSAVTSLYPVANRLPGALSDARALAADATPAVRDLQPPVDRLLPLSEGLRPLSADLDGAIQRLLPEIDTVDKVTTGLAGCKKGIQGFFQWNSSMSKFGDSRGPIPRGNVVLGAQSSGVLNDPNEFAPQGCTPGKVVGGRVPTEKDMH